MADPTTDPAPATDPAPVNDASKALQDLLGLSQISVQVQKAVTTIVAQLKALFLSAEFKKAFSGVIADGSASGLKKILADETYFGMLINILGDSMIHFATQVFTDPELEDKVHASGVKLISDNSVKGALADAVYHGTKRITEDGQAQQSLAGVANMIVSSQPFRKTVEDAIDTAYRRNKEYLASKEYMEKLAEQRDALVAKLQDTINMCLSENVQDLKNLRLSLSLSAVGTEETKESK